jgi:hypothetical protein
LAAKPLRSKRCSRDNRTPCRTRNFRNLTQRT